MKKLASVSALVLLVFAGTISSQAQTRLYGDVNGDGEVTIADVNEVIKVILGGTAPTPPPEIDDDYVDLGLPSGTLWATRNVGANSPEDYGDYFAWGETTPKDVFSWNNYKWCGYDGDGNFYISKYNKVDNKKELESADDAACANYPNGCMPSYEQIIELVNSCSWTWTQMNGVNGRLVTGPNGNTMFMPAAGCYRSSGSLVNVGKDVYYWSRTRGLSDYYYACSLTFDSNLVYGLWNNDKRCYGFVVRAVRVSQN